MGKKVFISHSSADKEIVSLFVDKILVAGCGIRQEDIMLTSCEDMGVENGEDIPSAIKQGILESRLFLMMVSEDYRKSEVCMNEMGAAWITESLKKCILLLPGVSFDKIGWLMSMNKADHLDQEAGLDHFHDQLIPLLGLPLKTSTWIKYRSEFLQAIKAMSAPLAVEEEPQEEEEDLDLLTIRERFENHTSAYVDCLHILTDTLGHYTDQLQTNSNKLNRVNTNPNTFNTGQVRGILTVMAKETNQLADIQDIQNPLLKRHFDGFIKYAILLQGSDVEPQTKRRTRKRCVRS